MRCQQDALKPSKCECGISDIYTYYIFARGMQLMYNDPRNQYQPPGPGQGRAPGNAQPPQQARQSMPGNANGMPPQGWPQPSQSPEGPPPTIGQTQVWPEPSQSWAGGPPPAGPNQGWPNPSQQWGNPAPAVGQTQVWPDPSQ